MKPNAIKYYGSDLSALDYERIAIERLPRKWLAHEPELQQTAWFDYRFTHPTHRTYLFAHYYKEAFQQQYGKVVDYETRLEVSGYARQDPLDNRGNMKGFVKNEKGEKVLDEQGKPVKKIGPKLALPTMLWRARQIADAVGIPYDFFTSVGLAIACDRLRAEKNITRSKATGAGKLLLGPQHLYAEDVFDKTQARWEERLLTSLRSPDSPFYKCENWQDHQYQIDLENYFVSNIQRLSNPVFALSFFVYRKKVFREERAREAFEESVLSKAKSFS